MTEGQNGFTNRIDGDSHKRMLSFAVDSHLLLELGEHLVSRKSIALGELVKNAYDADATRVEISFKNVRRKGGTIVVEDNGEGIGVNGLISGWMRIATDIKNREPLSKKYKRARTGSKGIGRFACRVLSDRLEIRSVAVRESGEKAELRFVIDWNKFESGTLVSSIPIEYELKPVDPSTETGVKLTMNRVREMWNDEDILELRKDLISLVSPKMAIGRKKGGTVGKEEDPGMEIILTAPDFEEISGELTDQYLESAWGLLQGEILDDSTAKYRLLIRGERNPLEFSTECSFPLVGRASFEIRYFSYTSELMEEFGLTRAREFGHERGGIGVYLDGFRVSKYGELGDDWLKLDYDRGRRVVAFRHLNPDDADPKRPALYLPGNNQLFGAVFLTRNDNPNLKPTITRDRMVSNEPLEQLQKFIRLGIEWMTVQYARWAVEDKLKKKSARRREAKEEHPTETIDNVINQLTERKDIDDQVKTRVISSLEMAKQTIIDHEDMRIDELAMLRVMASTGTMMSILEHELREMVDTVRVDSAELKKVGPQVVDKHVRETILGISQRLEEWATSIEQYGMQLGMLTGRESRDRRQSQPLRPILDDTVKPFRRHFRDYDIKFHNEVSATARLPAMYKCEIYSVFMNLITNSTKAVKKSPRREIRVYAEQTGKKLRILFEDTGPGVPVERREEVFRPFVSDSEPDPLLGSGTGLGLTIVKEIIKTYGGTVVFIEPAEDQGACLEIVLPLGG
jgi:signal transduction histidine kinase